MSGDVQVANRSVDHVALRYGVSLLLALGVNFLLILLIHFLVAGPRAGMKVPQRVNAVEFIQALPSGMGSVREDVGNDVEETNEVAPLAMGVQTTPVVAVPVERPMPSTREWPVPVVKLPPILSGRPYPGAFREEVARADGAGSPVSDPSPPGPGARRSRQAMSYTGGPVVHVPPVYPAGARRRGIEGRVVVEFLIGTDGSVKHPAIVEADPPRIFDQAVLKAVRGWRFAPRSAENGLGADVRARKEIRFELERR